MIWYISFCFSNLSFQENYFWNYNDYFKILTFPFCLSLRLCVKY